MSSESSLDLSRRRLAAISFLSNISPTEEINGDADGTKVTEIRLDCLQVRDITLHHSGPEFVTIAQQIIWHLAHHHIMCEVKVIVSNTSQGCFLTYTFGSVLDDLGISKNPDLVAIVLD